jgi:hypothetical protein
MTKSQTLGTQINTFANFKDQKCNLILKSKASKLWEKPKPILLLVNLTENAITSGARDAF